MSLRVIKQEMEDRKTSCKTSEKKRIRCYNLVKINKINNNNANSSVTNKIHTNIHFHDLHVNKIL